MNVHRFLGAIGLGLGLTVAGCGGSSDAGDSASATQAAAVAQPATQAQTAPVLPQSDPLASNVIDAMVSRGDPAAIERLKSQTAKTRPPPARIALDPLPASAQPATGVVRKTAASRMPLPLKIGTARDVRATASAEQVAALMGWSPSNRGGMVTALRFVSPNAKGVRVGLLVKALPLGGMVRFSADGADSVFEISAQDILTAIQRNLDAGDTSDAARTYWSPNLGGEAVTVEFELPPGTPVDAFQVAVPRLSHATVDMRSLSSIQKVGEAAACTLDVTCDASNASASKSVALMEFVQDGSAYLCTGNLMNDRVSSGTPYFLSANHCISSQTVASTLYTYWFYTSASCNSTQVNPQLKAMVSGATLLYASAATDTSFMRLNATPPAGAVYAGSAAFLPDRYADEVRAIHHPRGDLQKYNLGHYLGLAACDAASCVSSTASDANFLQVMWTRGVTEGGSSGSGLFTRLNGKDYLIGQLLGGESSCTAQFGFDYYGRFDTAYRASLSQWLAGASTTLRMPIYRLYNTRTQTHFYTADPAERDRTAEKLKDYISEGAAFYAYSAPVADTSPVYRFFDTRTGVHFYSSNDAERADIKKRLPWYVEEGVAWYAGVSDAGGSAPMYRFYNVQNQTHFYTTNGAERDIVQQRYPQYRFEGAAYYAWLSP